MNTYGILTFPIILKHTYNSSFSRNWTESCVHIQCRTNVLCSSYVQLVRGKPWCSAAKSPTMQWIMNTDSPSSLSALVQRRSASSCIKQQDTQLYANGLSSRGWSELTEPCKRSADEDEDYVSRNFSSSCKGQETSTLGTSSTQQTHTLINKAS